MSWAILFEQYNGKNTPIVARHRIFTIDSWLYSVIGTGYGVISRAWLHRIDDPDFKPIRVSNITVEQFNNLFKHYVRHPIFQDAVSSQYTYFSEKVVKAIRKELGI